MDSMTGDPSRSATAPLRENEQPPAASSQPAGLCLAALRRAASRYTATVRRAAATMLEVRLRAADGTIWGRIWLENKVWARFQPRQLERYGEALASRPGRGQLCVLAPAAYRVPQATADERARFRRMVDADVVTDCGARRGRAPGLG